MTPRQWAMMASLTLSIPAAALGLMLASPVSESTIIVRYAKAYVAEAGAGARITQCVGLPGGGVGVRLTVKCVHPNGRVYMYLAGPRGELRAPAPQQEPLA